MTIERFQPGAWNSRAVIHEGIAYLSGIVAVYPDVHEGC